jgi:hypothetical protein
MGPQTKTIGGGAATGFSDDFVKWLSGGLNTGTFGNPGQQFGAANPIGSTTGVSGALNYALGSGAQGDINSVIKQAQQQSIGDLRSRYSMGGTGTGSPSAYAESMFRAQAAPQAGIQLANLRMQYLQPLLQMMMGTAMRGTPQATTMVSPSPFMQAMSGLSGAAQGASGLMGGLSMFGGGGGLPSVNQLGLNDIDPGALQQIGAQMPPINMGPSLTSLYQPPQSQGMSF